MTAACDGLYALVSLDGAPLAARDLAALGLTQATDTRYALASCDGAKRTAVRDTALVLGHLDAATELAAALGLAKPSAVPAASDAALVGAALLRWGDAAPARIAGEWGYVAWDAAAEVLTLAASDTLRDPLVFATNGRCVAVAPSIRVLRRLDWVDAAPDLRSLVLHMGRAPLRRGIGNATILRDVRQVIAGTRVTIGRDGVRVGARPPLPAPAHWSGSFADAIAEIEALLDRIVQAQLARHPNAAVLLSGGLDSSINAVIAAAALPPGGTLLALTSAAPPGSGLADEVAFARAVADQAGIALRPVVPAEAADAYLPSAARLRHLQQPLASPRHYLYDALYAAAVDSGASGVFDGAQGEWTVTCHPDAGGWRPWLRDGLHRVPGRVRGHSAQDATHVRLGPATLAVAERALTRALRQHEPPPRMRRPNDPCGYARAIDTNLDEPTQTGMSGLRQLLPLRDRRLLTLFAGMPYRFLTEGGLPRAPGRALLAGKVPEQVRLRPAGLPFSPDYDRRLHRQADDARNRLPAYRRAGVGELVDLVWLDAALRSIAEQPVVPLKLAFAAQATAIAAAFLADWMTGTPDGA
ncbi:asparagine synthase-related protein [Sphingomonas sp. PAMC 26605]|uniref:asparagine synthase-related protein n=1 Tax=Sphingomonas sp. PAMC 26605 TaxID=1112214 RepID=UPI00026CDD3B|nr:asparagine synthase-related protein [Sphingomonas sp. PAMC 26605]